METYDIVFTAAAERDLLQLYDYIAAQAGLDRAHRYVAGIVAYCRGFSLFPEPGTLREDLRPELRLVGYGRRITIAFHTDARRVVFDRIPYGGRDLDDAFRDAR